MGFATWEEFGGEITIINCPERLNADVADDFRKIIKDLVDQEKFQLVVNLDKTKFIDSSGLGALVSRIAVTRSNKGDICLAGISPGIREVFQITNLDKIFKFYDSVELAIKNFE